MGEQGWLPDPFGRFEYRYFDGTQWTDRVSTGGTVNTDPPSSDPVPPTAPPPTLSPPPTPGGTAAPLPPSGIPDADVSSALPAHGTAHRSKLVPWLVGGIGVFVVVVVAGTLLVLFAGGGSDDGAMSVPEDAAPWSRSRRLAAAAGCS